MEYLINGGMLAILGFFGKMYLAGLEKRMMEKLEAANEVNREAHEAANEINREAHENITANIRDMKEDLRGRLLSIEEHLRK